MEDVIAALRRPPASLDGAAARVKCGDPVASNTIDPTKSAADIDASLGGSEAVDEGETDTDAAVLYLWRPMSVDASVVRVERDQPLRLSPAARKLPATKTRPRTGRSVLKLPASPISRRCGFQSQSTVAVEVRSAVIPGTG